MKRVVLAVTNDLSGDQRIHKVSMSLLKFGYSPLVIGRRFKQSHVLTRPYLCHRFRLLFNRGPLFYLEYNIRLFFFLLFSQYDCILSNDLDTLPASFLAGRLRNKRLVYDSHEYFTEVPELVGRPHTRRIWESIEAAIFPHLTSVYTVNGSIARIYAQRYGVPVGVVRNIPKLNAENPIQGELPASFSGHPIILYQGAVNIGRGLEEMIRAMTFLPECRMVVVGAGDCLKQLQDLVAELKLPDRVHFTGRLPFDRLAWYTRQATIGMSLEQNLGLSYYYSLPNKLFDYLHAGLPVIASDLPEIKKIVEEVSFGLVIDRFDPEFLSRQILFMINNPALLDQWRQNALEAASRYTWELEEEALKGYFPIVE